MDWILRITFQKIQKAQSYHSGFDLFIILSTFVQWQSLTTLSGIVAVISLIIDSGYFALMFLLISKCAGEYQNACLKTLPWDITLLVVIGIIVVFDLFQVLSIFKVSQLLEGEKTNYQTSLLYQRRLKILHLFSYPLGIFLLIWGLILDEDFDIEARQNFWTLPRIIIQPVLIWGCTNKMGLIALICAAGSITIGVSDLWCYYLSFLMHPIQPLTTYTIIKQWILSNLLAFDVFIIILQIGSVFLNIRQQNELKTAGENFKWFFRRQQDKIFNPDRKSS